MSVVLPDSQRLCRIAVMACATWGFALCGGSRVAWATCGDYLYHPHYDSVTLPSAPQPAWPGPVRCTGPNCRRAPLTPAFPSTPVTRLVPTDRWLSEADPIATEYTLHVQTCSARAPDARKVDGALNEVVHIPRAN